MWRGADLLAETRVPCLSVCLCVCVCVQISGSKSRNFYLRVARRFFGGSKERPAVDELLVTALGTAMNSAVAISDSLVKNQVSNRDAQANQQACRG